MVMDEHSKAPADGLETGDGAAQERDPAAQRAASAAHLTRVESPSAPDDAQVAATRRRAASAAARLIDKQIIVLSAARAREEFGFEEADAAGVAASGGSRRFRRLALPAVSLMLAVACGAAAGAAGVLSLGWLTPIFPHGAAAPEVANLPATIEQMRSDIAGVKASVDAVSRSDTAQFAKLTERFDHLERGQTTTKTDATFPKDAPKETTGSITVPSSTAAALPVPPAPTVASPTTIVPGWGVRDVYRGVALLQSRAGGMVEVEAGDILPGLGRIDAVRRQDGHWVVITTRGTIASMR
jgi:acyl dehydratase